MAPKRIVVDGSGIKTKVLERIGRRSCIIAHGTSCAGARSTSEETESWMSAEPICLSRGMSLSLCGELAWGDGPTRRKADCRSSSLRDIDRQCTQSRRRGIRDRIDRDEAEEDQSQGGPQTCTARFRCGISMLSEAFGPSVPICRNRS
jgi:hypothetical protein